MKFRICRTSRDYCQAEKPCDGAFVDKTIEEYGEIVNSWAIEVDSLDKLLEITKIEGAIVVHIPCDYYDGFPMIEIYDTYRE